jgi:glutamate 5-kinase
MSGRKQWIAFAAPPRGTLVVNPCARRALVVQRRSLLPIGVTGVEGQFRAGDTVRIVDEAGDEFARGIVGCDHREAAMVLGHHTQQIAALLGRDDLQELVHRDNLVLLNAPEAQSRSSAPARLDHPDP